MKLSDLTINEYFDLLSSKKSVPGGGSCLGLVLEASCSLGLMVCNFTLDKKGYENVQTEIFFLKEELNQIKNKAHNLIDEDGYAYQSVMEAYKSKDKEKISKASIYGSEVPYQLYFFTKKCEQLCSRLCQIGNKNLVSDAKIALDLCSSIYNGCIENIKCNVNGIDDINIKNKYLELIK